MNRLPGFRGPFYVSRFVHGGAAVAVHIEKKKLIAMKSTAATTT
jgi:hypothetical protein